MLQIFFPYITFLVYLLTFHVWVVFWISSQLQILLGHTHGFRAKWNNDGVLGDGAPLSSAEMKLVARISGSGPVGGSVHWPETEKGEVGHKCWSKFSQVPAALQINPTTGWALSASLVSISLPYCTHSRGSLSWASHCELPTGLHI